MSNLTRFRSNVVSVANNTIFKQCFQFWKQRALSTRRKQQFHQLKQEHILQVNILGWYSIQQKLKAISLGKQAMRLCQIKQRLEYCFKNWRQWLRQRRLKVNKGRQMLENWRIDKIQKITTGSSSSETTNSPSPELTNMTSKNATLIHIDCCQKWAILLEHQMHGILKRAMISWSLTMHNAQLKKLKEIMTSTMVINNWVKYLYQILFKRQIIRNQLQHWFNLLKTVTYAQ